MPITPDVDLLYPSKARLLDGQKLANKIGVTVAQIAEHSNCHENTVTSCLRGKTVQYLKAHDVMTSLNILSHNSFDRVKHVENFKGDNDFEAEPALSKCRVLARGRELLRVNNLKLEAVAKLADVSYVDANNVFSRRPVAANIVTAIFNVLKSTDAKLVEADEIIR